MIRTVLLSLRYAGMGRGSVEAGVAGGGMVVQVREVRREWQGQERSDRSHPLHSAIPSCSSHHSFGHLASGEKEPFSPETTSGSIAEPSAGKTGVSS